jgi:hypothetical protein
MPHSDQNEAPRPNHEAIPPEEAPAASPTLNAPPRVPKRGGWWWLALLLALCLVVLALGRR